jgi:ABC-type transporter Mla subunit MlaD
VAKVVTNRRIAAVVGSLILGVYLTGYYVTYLHRQSLREWRVLGVTFKDVGGLKKKSAVMVNGYAMGRVREVRFHGDGQLVVLELEPQLELYYEDEIQIVPTSALGFVGVQIEQAEPEDRKTLISSDPETIVSGTVRPTLGGGTPTGGRRKEIKRLIDDMVEATEDLTRRDGGVVGRMTADPNRITELRAGLAQFEKTWEDVDQGLARVEQRSSRISSEEYLLTIRATTQAMAETFGGTRDALRETMRGDGTFSEFVADSDSAKGWRGAMEGQARFWDAAKEGQVEGAVGTLVDPKERFHTAAREITDNWHEQTSAGLRGEGPFALLSSPDVGDEVRTILRDLSKGLDELNRGPLVRNPESRAQIEDLFGNADDLMNQFRRGLRGMRRGFPDRTFQGAVFSVF